MRIRLDIDRLVLDGLNLPAGSHGPLRAALEAELARRLGAGGLSRAVQAGGSWTALPAPPVQLPAAATPARLGEHIATAIWGAIGTTEPLP